MAKRSGKNIKAILLVGALCLLLIAVLLAVLFAAYTITQNRYSPPQNTESGAEPSDKNSGENSGSNPEQNIQSEQNADNSQQEAGSTTPRATELAIDQNFVDPPIPVPLPKPQRNLSYNSGASVQTWKFTSDLACADYALEVLQALQPTGVELLQAGYMDLSGQCWSCTIRTTDDQSINIVLLPQRIFSPRDESNQLQVTVIKMLQPEGL